MHEQEKIFLIEGHPFDKDGLISFCSGEISSPNTPGWEREIWEFIMDWFSPDEYLEVQTSGSTGKPKQIQLLKEHIRESARLTLDFFGLKPGDMALLCLPVKYIAGKMMVVRSLEGGLNLLLIKPSGIPDVRPFDKITFSAMVPMQVTELLSEYDGKIQLEKINKLIIGGSFIDKTLDDKLINSGNRIWQTYGMTETISHIALRKVNGPDATSWYSPLPGVDLKKDERGCLVITAPHIGVQDLITNDRVEFNEKGLFKVLGRTDNVVISGGVKLYPGEIEQKLSGLVENDFIVTGLPDNKLGEKLVLFIEGEDTFKSGKEDLWQDVKRRLSGYEVPKTIIFLKAFNRNSQGKIMRKMTVDNFLTNTL